MTEQQNTLSVSDRETGSRIICRRTETRNAEGYEISYTLTEMCGEGVFATVFSVTVSVKKGTYSDEASAWDITRDRVRAEELFDLLVRNTVTPCTLRDILSDIL